MEQSQCLELSQDHKVVKIIIIKGGFGYSDKVDASVTGSGGQDFILGPVFVSNGSIKVGIIKTGTWADTPLAYHGSDEHPFSGTVETKLAEVRFLRKPNIYQGKNMESTQDIAREVSLYFLRIMLAEKNMELTYFGSQVQWTPMTTKQRAKRVIPLFGWR